MSTINKFTPAFRRAAAVLVVEQGYSLDRACHAMSVSRSALKRWVNDLKAEKAVVSQRPKPEPKPNPDLERINDVLAELSRNRAELRRRILELDKTMEGLRRQREALKQNHVEDEAQDLLVLLGRLKPENYRQLLNVLSNVTQAH